MSKSISIKGDVYPLFRLIGPLALAGLVQSAVWFFETIFLAHLGSQTLAAGSLVGWFYGTLSVISFGALGSINIMVAHKHGENNQQAIAQIARDGLILAILLVIPVFMLIWYMPQAFLLIGQSVSVVSLARSYLHALVWSVPTNFIMMAFIEVIVGIGYSRVILAFSIIAVLLNIIFSYSLIFGKFGMPALGIAGAGWGMTLSSWISIAFLIIYISNSKKIRSYFSYIFKLYKPIYLSELLQIGIPIGTMYCVEVAFFFVLTLSMGTFGSQIQAANQVALQYLGLWMSTIFSVAQAITVRMGHLLGAKEVNSAEKTSMIGVSFSVILMSIIAVIYWLYPNALIAIDFDVHNPNNTTIVNEIEKFLKVSAIFQIVEAARIALFGSLRGLKDTRFTLLISIMSFWCIALPVGYLFSVYLQWGATGFWWMMIIGAGLSVILLSNRFNSKIKKY